MHVLHRYDLAELLLKLRHYEKAEKVLKVALEEEQSKHSNPILTFTRSPEQNTSTINVTLTFISSLKKV